jgi:uncharacterized protein (DUF2164 family)
MNERKKKLNDFLDQFKPEFQKNIDLTVELLRSGKTSNKYYNQGLLDAANAAKSVGDAVAEAVNAIKGAAKQSE